MSEFQLTQVALIGARMDIFRDYGFNQRTDLSLCRVIPNLPDKELESCSLAELQFIFRAQLPLWVHNIIADHGFPQRQKLLLPLRRFEGELRDGRKNEVVTAVLAAGFRNENLDPLHLHPAMSTVQRCAFVASIGLWQQAYKALEQDISALLAANISGLLQWIDLARLQQYSSAENPEAAQL